MDGMIFNAIFVKSNNVFKIVLKMFITFKSVQLFESFNNYWNDNTLIEIQFYYSNLGLNKATFKKNSQKLEWQN